MADSVPQSPSTAIKRRATLRQILSLPNQLTMLRLLLLPFILIAMIYRRHDTALALFLAAAATDVIDGTIARRFGQKTELGAYLDPLADKLLLSSAFIAQALIGTIPWWLTILVLSRDVVILATIVAVILATPIRDFAPSSFGKLNTVVQATTISMVILNNAHPMGWAAAGIAIMIWVVAATTLASSGDYMIQITQRLQRHFTEDEGEE